MINIDKHFIISIVGATVSILSLALISNVLINVDKLHPVVKTVEKVVMITPAVSPTATPSGVLKLKVK